MKRRIIESIIVGVVGITAIVMIFIFMKPKSADYDSNNAKDTISFIVVYQNNEIVIDEKLNFTEGESLYNIISRSHTIDCMESIGVGHAILSVDSYTTDWFNSYFALYYDGVYASLGVDLIIAQKDMEVKLVWTAVV